MPRSTLFDTSRIQLKPLNQRCHNLGLGVIQTLQPSKDIAPGIKKTAVKIQAARKKNAPIILMMGAHVLRSGVQRYLIDLIKKKYIDCIAVNGACVIHDFEFALIGATTESVSRYIEEGEFGFWQETGRINDIVTEAARKRMGLGEAVGKAIATGDFPHHTVSVLASAWKANIPVTVHVGIGSDIVHQHPNCDGAAWGAASYRDFLRLAAILENGDGGVIMNFGSAVTAPEVYLKALAMARNIARQEGRTIKKLTTLVCDLAPLPEDFTKEPDRCHHLYYFRPWKTMLVRTVKEGGQGIYVRGSHEHTIPQLWTSLVEHA